MAEPTDDSLFPAVNLNPGDRFIRFHDPLDTVVTVLDSSEPTTDLFGRPMRLFWCSRADTGAEGWVMFGPTGVVHRIQPSENLS